jgi:integrase
MQGKWTMPDLGYVFVAATTGGPLSPSRMYDVFHTVAKRAGIVGFRLHDLRHSCASFLNIGPSRGRAP